MRDSEWESRVPAGGTRLCCAKGEGAASRGAVEPRATASDVQGAEKADCSHENTSTLESRGQEEHGSSQSWSKVTSDSRQCDEQIDGYRTHHRRERSALQLANTLPPPNRRSQNKLHIHPSHAIMSR